MKNAYLVQTKENEAMSEKRAKEMKEKKDRLKVLYLQQPTMVALNKGGGYKEAGACP